MTEEKVFDKQVFEKRSAELTFAYRDDLADFATGRMDKAAVVSGEEYFACLAAMVQTLFDGAAKAVACYGHGIRMEESKFKEKLETILASQFLDALKLYQELKTETNEA